MSRILSNEEVLELWHAGKLRQIDPTKNFPKFASVSRCWCEKGECVGAGNLPIDEFCDKAKVTDDS